MSLNTWERDKKERQTIYECGNWGLDSVGVSEVYVPRRIRWGFGELSGQAE